MSRARLLWRNLADLGGLTASSETYEHGAELVQSDHLYETWRTDTTTANEWLQWDLTQPEDVQALALLGHDLVAGSDSVVLKAAATAAGLDSSPPVSQALTITSPNLVYCFAAQSYRYWRLEITKAAAGVARNLGRVYLGPYYECPRNPHAKGGWQVTPLDQSATTRSPYGPSFTDVRGQYERLQLQFKSAPQAQADQWETLAATLGTHTPLIVLGDYATRPLEWLYYGKLTSLGGRQLGAPDGAGGFFWDLSLTLETEP